MKPNPQTVYKACQAAFVKATNLKVGDTVKVLRTAKTDEFGWDNAWVSSMNACVGKQFTVYSVDGDGIGLDDGSHCSYPFFVLEKQKSNPMPTPIPLNSSGGYKASFNADRSINVGCQKISFETLERIYTAAQGIKVATPSPVVKKKVAKKAVRK